MRIKTNGTRSEDGSALCYAISMTQTILTVIFGLMLLPGLAMIFVPFLPAFWYLLAVAAIFGAIDGFVHLTLQNFAVLAAIFGASILVDWSAGLLGARLGGAAWKSVLFGALGASLGFLLLPPLGVLPGLFVGVLLGELHRRRSAPAALRAAGGALVGVVTGMAINAMLALLFIVSFVLFAL